MKALKLFFLLAIAGLSLGAAAQDYEVKGIVIDAYARPITGAKISTDKSKAVAYTDPSGVYTIEVEVGGIHHLGEVSLVIKFSGISIIDKEVQLVGMCFILLQYNSQFDVLIYFFGSTCRSCQDICWFVIWYH